MKKRAKIPLNPEQGGMNAAFASLSIPGLPDAPEAPSSMPLPTSPRRNPGRVVLRRETAHRGGKAVLVLHDFAPEIGDSEIDEIARTLRNECGCGGTRRQREIELQGEQITKVRRLLEERGFRVDGVR